MTQTTESVLSCSSGFGNKEVADLEKELITILSILHFFYFLSFFFFLVISIFLFFPLMMSDLSFSLKPRDHTDRQLRPMDVSCQPAHMGSNGNLHALREGSSHLDDRKCTGAF